MMVVKRFIDTKCVSILLFAIKYFVLRKKRNSKDLDQENDNSLKPLKYDLY